MQWLGACVGTKVHTYSWLYFYLCLGKGTCQWNGAGWKKNPGRFLHYKKTSHTYPWNLHGKTNLVSYLLIFFPKKNNNRLYCVLCFKINKTHRTPLVYIPLRPVSVCFSFYINVLFWNLVSTCSSLVCGHKKNIRPWFWLACSAVSGCFSTGS